MIQKPPSFCFFSLFILLSFGAIVSAEESAYAFPVQVETPYGVLEGDFDTQNNLRIFRGVPFAQPPVGELRWKAPQPLQKWEGVRPAHAFAPRPVQAPVFNDMRFRSPGMNEDCLYLNIWAPEAADGALLPVLVYFFGGGSVAGDSSEKRYDGAYLASQGLIVVTTNYRLNIFGQLAHPELSAESSYHGSGNYYLLDQAAALAWVYENIKAFGGDPSKITIGGESAGSRSVCYHMASPLSRPFIAGAIGESGSAVKRGASPLAVGEAAGLAFMKHAGAANMDELRAMSTYEIYQAYRSYRGPRFPTVMDHYFLTDQVSHTFEAGKQAQVPLLVGWNSMEGGFWRFFGLTVPDAKMVESKFRELYPEHAEKMLELYPFSNDEEALLAITDLSSDQIIGYETWKWFDLHRKNSEAPVYRFLFSKIRPRPYAAPPLKGPPAVGAGHAHEIDYVFGNLPLNDEFPWTEEDYKASKTASAYFANFIKKGNPNGDGLPEWPEAGDSESAPWVMILDAESQSQPAAKDKRYLFTDRLNTD